jgi:hypothetical protein
MAENTIRSLKTSQSFSPTVLARALRKDPSTIWRWLNKGVVVRGQRIVLGATRVGGRIHITETDINTFLRQLNQPDTEDAATPAEQVPGSSEAETFCKNHQL